MMKQLALSGVLMFIVGTITGTNAASTLKLTCSGALANTREGGVTVGQCDLNFLSVKQMTEIENVCGLPGTDVSPAENECRVRGCLTRSNYSCGS
jgi:hypothetical protein